MARRLRRQEMKNKEKAGGARAVPTQYERPVNYAQKEKGQTEKAN